ncbi:hypothetical protein EIP91_003568 [Steccherinum ochraceum]|uniref:OTU domain-containing protein n=1 Tax=Steccherinum ochraceum TaxID=92696 RepID=A0A4R0RR13_9APHY|nr:hypothetical protein EIP91_003568 [Steccherinum ochraceum]
MNRLQKWAQVQPAGEGWLESCADKRPRLHRLPTTIIPLSVVDDDEQTVATIAPAILSIPMGHTKRRHTRPAPQARTSRATRSKGRLRGLGLYAAPTLGDGNCLFRALSDQLYGTDHYHASLRQAICNWIQSHKHRYAPFVDDERGLDVHLECMRQQATYGGHLELSAFAHMTRRNVKVIQPGLVYVIEWNAGGDPSQDSPASSPLQTSAPLLPAHGDASSSGRDKRRATRDSKRSHDEPLPELPDDASESSDYPIYVAYHDWEHFSSIRNLRGPHAGLPNVREMSSPEDSGSPLPSPPRKPSSKAKAKAAKPVSKTKKLPTSALAAETTPALPLTPTQVPLPVSRSPSPDTFSHGPLSSRSSILPSTPTEIMRAYRSPKRTFDESSASSEESHQGIAKRPKPGSQLSQTDSLPDIVPTTTPEDDVSIDVDDDLDTPSLSAASPASSSSLSSVPSPAGSPEPQPAPKPLTRRQRKQLGLPKQRPALVGSARASAGKIVIPGGKFRPKSNGETEEEWMKNGTGRVDVRGFRELKI